MPYYVYDVTTQADSDQKALDFVKALDAYKAARSLVRARRDELSGQHGRDCRLIFAQNQTEAVKLLSAPREQRVVGED